jgi:hypothetical protein
VDNVDRWYGSGGVALTHVGSLLSVIKGYDAMW